MFAFSKGNDLPMIALRGPAASLPMEELWKMP
jgi:hypothetical protein